MISTLAAACVILLAFRKIMLIILGHDAEWDCAPVVLLFLTVITAVRFRDHLHRRLT